MDQVPPFHTSASVFVVAPVVDWPTAWHAVAEVQETPLSSLLDAPPGLGVAWMDQLPPAHTSASVSTVAPLVNSPTASHTVADGHEMPLSCPAPGSGMVTTVHVLPLRVSARRWLSAFPTAMQAPGDVHATALRSQTDAPCGIAVPCCSQLAVAGWATISARGTTSAAVITSRFMANRVIVTPPGDISPPSAPTGTGRTVR